MEASVADPWSVSDLALVLQIPHIAEGEDQSKVVQPERASQSNLVEDSAVDDHSNKPSEPQPE